MTEIQRFVTYKDDGGVRLAISKQDEPMSIKRDDLDAGRVDFSEVVTGKRLPLIHPGEILRDDFLRPMKISVYALALAIKAPRSPVNDIVLGRRGISADTPRFDAGGEGFTGRPLQFDHCDGSGRCGLATLPFGQAARGLTSRSIRRRSLRSAASRSWRA